MSANDPLNLLVIDVYSNSGRQRTEDAGALQVGPLFEQAIRLHEPDAHVDVLTFNIDAMDDLPRIEGRDGVIWSGSNLTIHRTSDLIDTQVAFCQAVFDAQVPQFGICYGIQLGALATGGVVEANPKGPEIAWARDIKLNEAGRDHPMYAGKSDAFDALCWHSDTVTQLPDNADLLASNGMSDVQAAIFHRNGSEFWATQYHPEFDGEQVALLLGSYEEGLVAGGIFASEKDVHHLAADMKALKLAEASDTEVSDPLRPVVDPKLRTQELGNWLASLRQKRNTKP